MKREHLLTALFFLFIAVFLYLFYRIIIPFFVPITWAAVFTILFYPLYEWLCRRVKRRGLASLIMCVFIIILIIGPITYLFTALVNEAATAVSRVREMYEAGQFDKWLAVDLPIFEQIKAKLSEYYDISQINLEQIIKDSIDRVSGVILNQTSWIIANTTKAVFYFVLMIFTTYYFFRDGEGIVNTVKRLMPITPEQVEITFRQLRDVIQATMYGGVVVALIQGALGGILFAIVGIPSPIFWGAIMAFLSIIPFLGAFLVYIPAGLILIVQGSYVTGLIVIAFGTIVISQIDNVLRPFLISGRAQMHPLMLFFALLGGIALFGLLGLVVGPLIAAVFVAVLKIIELRLHPDQTGTEARATETAASE